MIISAAIIQRMNLNVEQVVRKIQSRPIPERIFHYTNGPGFIGIIESKRFWATHIAFTNDSKEYFGASELVQSKVDALLNTASITPPQRRVLTAVKNNLGHSINHMYHCFVTCFSECKDDLAQWRGYSGKEGKYKISFDVPHLNQLTAESNRTRGLHSQNPEFICYLMPVIYKQSEKESLLNDILNFVLLQYPLDEAVVNPADRGVFANSWANAYVETATMLAPLVKDSGFSQEAEWRLMIVPVTDKIVKYRSRGVLLTPYVEFDLKSPLPMGMLPYPLREVWIGPSAHMDLNQAAAEHLLRREGVKAALKQSSIPYRDI